MANFRLCKKHRVYTKILEKFAWMSVCDMSQEASRNCSEQHVQMNFTNFGWYFFFRGDFFSLRSCRSSSVNFWLSPGNLAGIQRIFFGPQEMKARNFLGKNQSVFCKIIRSSIRIFRAKFALQTCHLKDFSPLNFPHLPHFCCPHFQTSPRFPSFVLQTPLRPQLESG